MFNNYQKMANFCPFKTPTDDPVTYCVMDGESLDSKFSHGTGGGSLTQYSRQCQAFMSTRCALNWDDKCEFASKNSEQRFPNMIANCGELDLSKLMNSELTAGDILVLNTAEKKYGKMSGTCSIKKEPFDATVTTSPQVEYRIYTGHADNKCKTTYDINPQSIDSDPVMNKLLDRPRMSAVILVKIYRSLKSRGELSKINNTRLGFFYKSYPEIFK